MSSDSASRCRSILHDQFEELRPVTAVYLGEGCDSVAFEVNGKFVFRFPKRSDVEEQFAIEARLLPALAPALPLPIPAFCFFGQPTPAFPRRFVGYPKLPGRPAILLDPAEILPLQLASTLGHFLSSLHAFPVEHAKAAGVPEPSLTSLIDEVRQDALDDLATVARVAPHLPIAELRDRLATAPGAASPVRVLVHDDLAAEHVLVDARAHEVTGVIDWSDAAISEPAVDFAGMFHWGGDRFAEAVLAAYRGPIDGALRPRARFMALCRGVMDIAFGHEFGKPEYITAGLRALRLCHNPGDLEPQ